MARRKASRDRPLSDPTRARFVRQVLDRKQRAKERAARELVQGDPRKLADVLARIAKCIEIAEGSDE